jgi:hypothetical protein
VEVGAAAAVIRALPALLFFPVAALAAHHGLRSGTTPQTSALLSLILSRLAAHQVQREQVLTAALVV